MFSFFHPFNQPLIRIKIIKLTVMDMSDALTLWESLGFEWASWDAKQGYYTLFIKDGEVVGHIKAVAGFISWEYPEELMQARKKHKEIA